MGGFLVFALVFFIIVLLDFWGFFLRGLGGGSEYYRHVVAGYHM